MTIFAVRLEDIARDPRGGLAPLPEEDATPQEAEDDGEEPVVGFWKSTARAERHLPMRFAGVDLDYFISHTWQPHPTLGGPDPVSHALLKATALHDFGVKQSALYGKAPPRCLASTAGQKAGAAAAEEPAGEDPKEAWRDSMCWVDKACAATAAPTSGPQAPNTGPAGHELAVRLTKQALQGCRTFVALLTGSYFGRLWCAFEWATSLLRVAPQYRRLEVVVPADLMVPQSWRHLVESAAGFALGALRSSGEAEHPELWRELEEMVVSTPAFERLMQCSALSALARHALLVVEPDGPAFSNDLGLVEEVARVADGLGLRGLAGACRAVRPKVWWQQACHRVKLAREKARRRPGHDDPLANDPLERLARAIEARLRKAESDAAREMARKKPGSKRAGAYAMQCIEMMSKQDTMALEHLHKWAKRATETLENEESSESDDEVDEVPLARVTRVQRHLTAAEFQEEFNWTRSATIVGNMFRSAPDGYGNFWRGLDGAVLDEEERERARFFRDAWNFYRDRIDRWFDCHVSRHIELWRQRGIRCRGAVEEAFSVAFLPIGTPLQDFLCERLAPGMREQALAREPPPRGRPARLPQAPWANPTLDRLLVVSRPPRAGVKDQAAVPTLICSPLRLQIVDAPRRVFCVRPAEPQEWRRVSLPRRMGSEVFTNALKHLLGTSKIQGTEIQALIPQVTLEVLGSGGVRATVGTFVSGTFQDPKRGAAGRRVAARATAVRLLAEASLLAMEYVPPGSASGSDSSEEDEEEEEPYAWQQWRVKVDIAAAVRRKPPPDDRHQQALEDVPPGMADARDGSSGEVAAPPLRDTEIPCAGVARHLECVVASAWVPNPTKQLVVSRRGGAPFAPSVREAPLNPRNRGPGGLLPKFALPLPPRPPDTDLASTALSAKWKTGGGPPYRPRPGRDKSDPLPKLDLTPRGLKALPQEGKGKDGVATVPPPPSAGRVIPSPMMRPLELCVRTEGSVPVYGGCWKGAPAQIFEEFNDWLAESCFAQWVPVDAMADECGSPLDFRPFPGESSAPGLQATTKAIKDVQQEFLPPLALGSACRVCSHTDVAKQSLQGSLLSHVWETSVCVVCLKCGHAEPCSEADLQGRYATATDGDVVLEVATSVPLKHGQSVAVQRLACRILRVEPGQISVAAPVHQKERGSSSAKPRVGYMSFATREASICAAVAIVHSQKSGPPAGGGPFRNDSDWAHNCLADTGLDLVYGEDRSVTLDIAIEELDDQRMMPRRLEVPPLVLWAELGYVLSADFNFVRWNLALVHVVAKGHFSLPGTLMMRRNIERLRHALGASHVESEGRDSPAVWPLALHRVLLARAGDAAAVLGTGLARAGVEDGGPQELRARGRAALAEASQRTAAFGHMLAGKEVDASSILRDLSYRRMLSNAEGALTFRLVMRARRMLREVQVSRYLQKLYEKVMQNGIGEPEPDEKSEDSDEEEDDDEEKEDVAYSDETDSSDEDAGHANGLKRGEKTYAELTVQKVLGHAREYVDHKDICLKALEVLNIMIQTASRFYGAMAAVGDRRGRQGFLDLRARGKKLGAAAPVLQVVLDQGYVQTAIRAIYRHPSVPEIGVNALELLEFLVRENAEHSCKQSVLHDLANPPERMLSLLLGAGQFSAAGHKKPLYLSLKVLSALVPWWSQEPPPQFPVRREAEAAQALIHIFNSHSKDEQIFILSLHLLVGFERDKPMLLAFWDSGLTKAVRRWLLRSAEGEVLESWRAASGTGQMQRRPSIVQSGLKALKQATANLVAMRERIHQCEALAWDLLRTATIRHAKHKAEQEALLAATMTSETIPESPDEVVLSPTPVEQTSQYPRHFSPATVRSNADSVAELQSPPPRHVSSSVGRSNAESAEGIRDADSGRPSPAPPSDPGGDLRGGRSPPMAGGPTRRGGPRRTTLMEDIRHGHGAHHKIQEDDAYTTVGQALAEILRTPRGSQWRPAVSCLTALVSFDRPTHSPRVADGTYLGLLLAELPAGDALTTLPLLRALLDAEGAPPEGPKCAGEDADEDDEDSSDDIRPGYGAAEAKAEEPTFPPTQVAARVWLAKHGGVVALLKALEKHQASATLQTSILRMLGEVIEGAGAGAKAAAMELDGYNKPPAFGTVQEPGSFKPGGGAGVVIRAIQTHIKDSRLVDAGLHALLAAIQRDSNLPAKLAGLPFALECLIDVIWHYLGDARDPRRRALFALSKIRESTPLATEAMGELWQKWSTLHARKFGRVSFTKAGAAATAAAAAAPPAASSPAGEAPKAPSPLPAALGPEALPTTAQARARATVAGVEAIRLPEGPQTRFLPGRGRATLAAGAQVGRLLQAHETATPTASPTPIAEETPEPEESSDAGGGDSQESGPGEVAESEGGQAAQGESRRRTQARMAVLDGEPRGSSPATPEVAAKAAGGGRKAGKRLALKSAPDIPQRLPGEVRRFGAYIAVHHYVLKKGKGPFDDVVAAIEQHPEDEEICTVGLSGLMKGNDAELTARFKELAELNDFMGVLRAVVLRFRGGEVPQMAMKLTSRILEMQKTKLQPSDELPEACAVSISTVLESQKAWNTQEWEGLLEAVDSLGGPRGTDIGRRLIARLDIMNRLEEEWEKIIAREDPGAKVVVKTYKADTERILRSLL